MQGAVKTLPRGRAPRSSSSSWAARWARWSASASCAACACAIEQKLPFICFTATRRRAHAGRPAVADADGEDHRGADAARRAQRLPFISVLTDPTMGGVSASFAMIGDVVIAEPERADRLRRPARHRADGARDAARRLPARRVPAREGRDRHDRRPPPDARPRRRTLLTPAACALPPRRAAERTGVPHCPHAAPRRPRRLARLHRAPAPADHRARARPRRARCATRSGSRPPCPLITVGGTNGKGSTCAMLEAILRAAGYRVGLLHLAAPAALQRARAHRRRARPTDAALVRGVRSASRRRAATSRSPISSSARSPRG